MKIIILILALVILLLLWKILGLTRNNNKRTHSFIKKMKTDKRLKRELLSRINGISKYEHTINIYDEIVATPRIEFGGNKHEFGHDYE